jgi:hypothetical protein
MTNPTESLQIQVIEKIFDLKEPLLISNNIEKRDLLTVAPTTASGGAINGSSDIDFELNNTQNYITLFDSFVKISVKFLQKDDKTAIANTDAPEHNWVAGLFKSARLFIGGKEVEYIADVRAATSLLGHCLHSKNKCQTYGEQEGWIPDEVTNAVNNTNLGWKRRQDIYSNGADVMEVILPLRNIFGFCDVNKILYLIPIKLQLQRNDKDKLIFSGTGTEEPKTVITSIQWCVPTITPSAERKKAINDLLLSSDFIPFVFLKRSIFPKDITESESWTIKTTAAQPRYFIIGFKGTGVETASYTANNSAWEHASVTEIHLNINQNLYPIKPMSLNFDKKKIMDAYNSYAAFCFRNFVEPPLSVKEFINFYTIYVIDSSAQSESLRLNSILIQLEIKRATGSPKVKGYAMILEDEVRMGIKVNNGVMAEFQ